MIERKRELIVRDGDPHDDANLRIVTMDRDERDGDNHGRVVAVHVEDIPFVTLTDLRELGEALIQLHDEIESDS